MSYNLLLNTNFTNTDNLERWKLTNCEFKNGYLISNDNVFSIEQEIILPDPTKLYFSMDYICFGKDITSIYCGIQIKNTLEVTKKKPTLNKRKRISVTSQIFEEKIKVIFICESNIKENKIYIDSPLLIDLTFHNKDWWPKNMLDRHFDFRYGYEYENIYKYGSEITLNNPDFSSPYTKTEEGKVGVLINVVENDWFKISHNFEDNHNYLLKLDYKQINNYGNIYITYGDIASSEINNDQLYIIFKANNKDEIKINLDNNEKLPYLVNLKHILLVDLTHLKIEENDIKHLPFI